MRNRSLLLCAMLCGCATAPQPTPNVTDISLPETRAAVPAGDFLSTLYTYPTGQFDPRWVAKARLDDAKLGAGKPKGKHPLAKGTGALDPAAFTALGPQPISNRGDRNSGRVNDIVVSPQPLFAGNPNSYRAFIATDGGGVWRSENCCSALTTFAPVTDTPEIQSIAIGDLAMDPNNPDVIYAGTGDLRFGSWSFGSAGLLQSTDGGDSWRVLGRDQFGPNYPASLSAYSQHQAIGKIAVDPNQSNNLIVGTKTGLYFSYDRGENWTGPCLTNEFGPDSGNAHRQDITALLALDLAGSTRLYAAVGTRGQATPVQPDLDLNGANGIYRTSMPGAGCPAQWEPISRADNGWPAELGNGNAFGPIGRIELAAAPSDPNFLYAEAVAAQGFAIFGLWRSSDGGDSWQPRATEADFFGCPPGTQNWYNAGIAVLPDNVNHLLLSAWWTYRSTDAAATFNNLQCIDEQAFVHIDQHAIAFVGDDPDRLLIGNDGGVYYSANGRAPSPTFVPINDSINSIEFYSGDISADFNTADQRVVIGGAQDNGTSTLVQRGFPARADEWQHIFGGDGITARIEPVFGRRVYMSSQRGNIVLSSNGANSPESDADGPWENDRRSFLMPYDLYRYGDTGDPDSGCGGSEGCSHLIAGTFRVWESTNGAQGSTASSRWRAISPDLTKNNLRVGSDNRSVIQAIRFAVSSDDIAMVGTLDGKAWYGFDLGTENPRWVDLTDDNAVLPNRSILDVATDPQVPTIGYAAVAGFGANTPQTPGHVYQVRCNADCSSFNWRDVSGDLPDVPINAVVVNPWIPSQVFAGSDWGLYYTDNIEAANPSWRHFEGLPRAMIWEMAIDRGFTTLAVFTRSRGAWAWPLPRSLPVTGPVDEPSLSRYALPAPDPDNPFCPAGYFTATISDGPGDGLQPGIFGVELLLDDPGTRLLQGGLNFGGLVDAGQVGFAGVNLTNPAGEDQILNLSLTGSPSSDPNATLPVRIQVMRQSNDGSSVSVFDQPAVLALNQPATASVVVPPGYYVATVGLADTAAELIGGAAEGQFYFELTTQFVDRPGGAFQGGAVVGGYHAEHPFGGVSGFAAFCISTPHSASVSVLGAPSYGQSGAGDLRLRVLEQNQAPLIAVPID